MLRERGRLGSCLLDSSHSGLFLYVTLDWLFTCFREDTTFTLLLTQLSVWSDQHRSDIPRRFHTFESFYGRLQKITEDVYLVCSFGYRSGSLRQLRFIIASLSNTTNASAIAADVKLLTHILLARKFLARCKSDRPPQMTKSNRSHDMMPSPCARSNPTPLLNIASKVKPERQPCRSLSPSHISTSRCSSTADGRQII